MKLYIVSSEEVLEYNSGFVKFITSKHTEAVSRALVGQFIHVVDVGSVFSVEKSLLQVGISHGGAE